MAVDDVQEIEALAELGIAAGEGHKPYSWAQACCAGVCHSHGQLLQQQQPVWPVFWQQFLSFLTRFFSMGCMGSYSQDSMCSCFAAADVKKAKEGGFHTVQSLIMNPRKVSICIVLMLVHVLQVQTAGHRMTT